MHIAILYTLTFYGFHTHTVLSLSEAYKRLLEP